MQRKAWIFLIALGLLVGGPACSAQTGLSKAQVRADVASGKADAAGEEPCAEAGWYGDGECDDFCPEPDPDCPSEARMCGGLAGLPCPEGQRCVDDPSDDCDPDAGWSDCEGVCVVDDGSGDDPPGDDPPGDEAYTFCGGFAGIECPDGQLCVDDPRDDCDHLGADCGGVCIDADARSCGGFAGTECPDGDACVDDPRDNCEPGDVDCAGLCVPGGGTSGDGDDDMPGDDPADGSDVNVCGGIAGLSCPAGQECVDDPRDQCDPDTGADCQGFCVDAESVPCGGFGGRTCSDGEMCVDDPRDDCDPDDGGSDCGGLCAPLRCGGLVGGGCPMGYQCVDDPRDDCDPDAGWSDCFGICVGA